jgi:hypothetical protein
VLYGAFVSWSLVTDSAGRPSAAPGLSSDDATLAAPRVLTEQVNPVERELALHVDDGQGIRYPPSGLYSLAHAFASSVHKAQGAEFPVVVLRLMTNHAALLSRTLLYTAMTRARELLVIVGQQRAAVLAVRDWRRSPRQTALEGLLRGSLSYDWRAADLMTADPDVWEGLLLGSQGESL